MSPGPVRSGDPSWAFLAPVDLRDHGLPTQVAFGFHRGRTEELLGRAADTIARLTRQLNDAQAAQERLARERAELEAVRAEAEQAKRLAAETRRRSVAALQRALAALNDGAGEVSADFATAERSPGL